MRSLRQFRLLFPLIIISSFLSIAARADVWTAPVAVLAQRIVSKAGPGTAVTVTVKNLSSLSAADVNAVRTQIDSELRSRGLRLVDAEQSVADLRITLSENVENYLLIAEIRQGTSVDTVFTKVTRSDSVAARSAGAMTLQRRLLWTQDEPILDVALVGAQILPGAIILTPGKVAYYLIQNGTWQEADAAVLSHTRPLPRDARGMIVGAGNNPFEVVLPGVRCTISGNNPYRAACADTDDPWPMYEGQPRLDAFFSPTRNFFTGAISRSGDSVTVPAFYSAAMFGNSEWLFTGTDGRVQYSSFVNTLPVPVTNWGSDIASIRSKCSPDAVILATRNGDYTQPDAVQGFQVIARDPVAVTAALDFAGPVMALRASGGVATVVSHNLKTGKYEAYSLTLACNQ
jgi:hypothetical protein